MRSWATDRAPLSWEPWRVLPAHGYPDPRATRRLGHTPATPVELYGLPREGAGSLAPLAPSRRAVHRLVHRGRDRGADRPQLRLSSSVPLLVWFVVGVAAVTLFGFTPGQYFMKLRVLRIDAPVAVGIRARAGQAGAAGVRGARAVHRCRRPRHARPGHRDGTGQRSLSCLDLLVVAHSNTIRPCH